RQAGFPECFDDILLCSAVKDRRGYLPAECLGGIAKVHFKDLSDVHTRRNTQGVEYYFKRGAVGQVRHILFGEYPRNDALVPVPSCHLVPDRYLSLLGYIDPYDLVYPCRQFVTLLSREHLDVDNDARFAVGDSQRCIPYFSCLFTEYRPEQPLFGGQFRLSLGSDLADQYIACPDLGAYPYDAPVVEVLARI